MPRRKAHSSNSSILVLFRDRLGLKEARPVLKKSKRKFSLVEAIEIKLKKFKPKLNSYDFVLITSAHAFDALKKNVKINKISAKSWVAIGLRSAERLKAEGIKNIHMLKEGNTQSLKKFFRSHSAKSILYPHSSLTELRNLKFLARGRLLDAPVAYVTKVLSIEKQMNYLFKTRKKFIFLLMSPSGVSAIKRSVTSRNLQRFVKAWIAIGPTTATAINKIGFKARVAKKPIFKEMLNLLNVKSE